MSKETYPAGYINDLVRRSGQSRATVFRKLKDGWTEDEIVARRRGGEPASVDGLFPAPKNEDPASVEPPAADDTQFALKWAQAVMWAADNLDMPKKAMTRQKAGSALKYNLYLLGKDDLRQLHGNLVPRALNILDKHRNPEGGEVARAEDRNVEELTAILKQAIEESREQLKERN